MSFLLALAACSNFDPNNLLPEDDPKNPNSSNNNTDDTGTNNTTTPSECEGVTGLRFNPDPVILVGENEGDEAGANGAIAYGDVNGDGIDDIVIGALNWSSDIAHADTLGTANEGRVYIVSGSNDFYQSGEKNLGDVDISKITGDGYQMFLGTSVAVAHLDTDKYAEILIGIPGYNLSEAKNWFDHGDGSSSGGIVTVNGRDNWAENYQLANNDVDNLPLLSAYEMAILKGDNDESIGDFVFPVGDFNGDGTNELVLGKSNICNAIAAINYEGIENVHDHISFKFQDDFTSEICENVIGNDIDGDGITDLFFGDVRANEGGFGEGFIFYGDTNFPFLTDFSAPTAHYAHFEEMDDTAYAFNSINLANYDGDENGLLDLVISATKKDNGHVDAGAVYIVPNVGRLSNASNITLGTSEDFIENPVDSNQFDFGGIAIYGANTGDKIGSSVGIATDKNCPNISTMVIGAATLADSPDGSLFRFSNNNVNNALQTEFTVSDADESTTGYLGSHMGEKVIAGGDFNGDGIIDLLVNAPSYNNYSGAILVYFGERY